MALDLSRTSAELLIERINIDNNLEGKWALTTKSVSLDLPFVTAPDARGRNTTVLLLARPGVRYRGIQSVYYKRYDVADYLAKVSADPVRLSVDDAKTSRDLVPRLNELYKMNVLPTEVRDDPITAGYDDHKQGIPHDIVFTASYVFVGALPVTIGTEHQRLAIQLENGEPMQWEDSLVMTFESI